jgi:CubicO group peptidase (beta-lactamase class C family)
VNVRACLVVGIILAAAATGCTDDAGSVATETSAGTGTVASTDAPTTDAPTTDAPTTTVPTSTSGPTSTAPVSTVAPRTYDFAAVDPVVQAFLDANGVSGAGLIVVHEDDGVVHEDYWGEFDADRISFVASASKSIVGIVLLHLHDRGVLDVDAPVADVVDWGAAHPTITPAQLVSNSSGLLGLTDALTNPSQLCQYVPDGTMQDCAAQIFTTPDDDAGTIPPDTEFRYGGGQWQVAGAVAEAASGTSWAELVDEILVQPCGVDSLGFTNQWTLFGSGFSYPTAWDGDPASLPPTANPNMEGGAYVTARDYGTLLLMQLRNGRCGDEQVLTPESLERLHENRTGRVYDSPTGYGMGWWVDTGTGRRTDPGAYGAVPWLDLDDGYGAYLAFEGGASLGNQLAAELYDVVEQAIASAR